MKRVEFNPPRTFYNCVCTFNVDIKLYLVLLSPQKDDAKIFLVYISSMHD